MIDLIAYEKDLLYQKKHGMPLRPPPLPNSPPAQFVLDRANWDAAIDLFDSIQAMPTTETTQQEGLRVLRKELFEKVKQIEPHDLGGPYISAAWVLSRLESILLMRAK